jgi:HTH-type transcriptional regulator/antitoxin HigA
MTKIENEQQYREALQRVEQLLPLVTDDTPLSDPNSIELDRLSHLVAAYSDAHFAIADHSAECVAMHRRCRLS